MVGAHEVVKRSKVIMETWEHLILQEEHNTTIQGKGGKSDNCTKVNSGKVYTFLVDYTLNTSIS